MQLGRRDKVPFPESYKGFRLTRTHGRVFGVPARGGPSDSRDIEGVITHPAVLSASTLDELRDRIDGLDGEAAGREVVGACGEYDLVRHRGQLYGILRSAGSVDMDLPSERRRAGAVAGGNRGEIEASLRRRADAAPVEFAGWLPIYSFSGNCGTHPQFAHAGEPPAGYRFTCSAPPPVRKVPRTAGAVLRLREAAVRLALGLVAVGRVFAAFLRPRPGVGLRSRARVFAAMVRLLVRLLGAGCKLRHVLRFLQSRHLESQLLLGNRRGPVFLTSMPYTFGQDPWAIEIEDPTTLFYPLIQNGHTGGLTIQDSPYFPIVKALLEADHCKAILTHMRSTAELVPAMFRSEIVREKVVYAPLGVALPSRWQRHDPEGDDAPIHLLFINSWCQVPENFYVRGGLDLLEAYATLRVRYPQLRLTMRTSLPALADHYHGILADGWVRIFNRFLPAEEMAALHAESHIFVLPAARVHIVSLLQAMGHGLAVVATDGWGVEEYVEHGRNGLIVKGRYGKTSWADPEAGMLREDYDYTHTADPEVVAGLVEAVSRLAEDRLLRRRLGRAARQDVEMKFNPDNWNRGLAEALDRATGKDRAAPRRAEAAAVPERQTA